MLSDKTREDAKIYTAMVVPVLRMDQQHGHYWKTGITNKAAEMKFFKTCSRLYKNMLNPSKRVAEKLKIFVLSSIIFQYGSEWKYCFTNIKRLPLNGFESLNQGKEEMWDVRYQMISQKKCGGVIIHCCPLYKYINCESYCHRCK
jgi:hypothetical protein